MITDKEDLGIKIAENPEEAFWTRTKESATKQIFNLAREIEINEEILKLAERKLSSNA